jgi:hypothetical protein
MSRKELVKKFILWRKLHPNYSSRCHYCKIYHFPKTQQDLNHNKKCESYWDFPYGCTEFLKKENYKTKE